MGMMSVSSVVGGASRDTQKPRRVLIVDDLRDITATLGELVALLGHEVFVANHGDEALELVGTMHPDLVLLDLGMPEPNGFEVARRLRARPDGKRIELVAMSGWGHQAARERATAAGFDRHFLKPITLAQLHVLLGASRHAATTS